MLEDFKKELEARKTILEDHLTKFNRLKEEQNWAEAFKQMVVALKYANETLRFTTDGLTTELNSIIKEEAEDTGTELNAGQTDVKETGEKIIPPVVDNSDSLKTVAATKETLVDNKIKKMIVIPKKQSMH